jgi:phosphotransferase family enzyme
MSDEEIRIISRQGGCIVREHDGCYITKTGARVRRAEEEALKLVKQYTDVPVPDIIYSIYKADIDQGQLGMTLIPGSPLQLSWSNLDDATKGRVCSETWDMIAKWRKIPQPPKLSRFFQCSADGSPTYDVLIRDLADPPMNLVDDDALRARIFERYLYHGGRRYEKELPDMLPRSSCSVFTHGDIAPRNIMVDQDNRITGILDWENAGWYPDYWEYANMSAVACRYDDWQTWMDRTAPQKWDITGINAARRVLF